MENMTLITTFTKIRQGQFMKKYSVIRNIGERVMDETVSCVVSVEQYLILKFLLSGLLD